MSNQWYNCKMEHKHSGKIVEALRVGKDTYCPLTMSMKPDAVYYSQDYTEFKREHWREVEHEEDYRDAKIAVVDWNMDDQLWLAISALIITGICAYFGLR